SGGTSGPSRAHSRRPSRAPFQERTGGRPRRAWGAAGRGASRGRPQAVARYILRMYCLSVSDSLVLFGAWEPSGVRPLGNEYIMIEVGSTAVNWVMVLL